MTIKTVVEHNKNAFDSALEILFTADPSATVLYMGTEVEELPRAAGQQRTQRLHLVAVLKSDL